MGLTVDTTWFPIMVEIKMYPLWVTMGSIPPRGVAWATLCEEAKVLPTHVRMLREKR